MATLKTLTADLVAAGEGIDDRAATVVAKTGHDIEAVAKHLVPVDTGATKNSITVQPVTSDGLEVEVGPETHYAPYLEHGTYKMAPRPFMGPAADRAEPGFWEAIAVIAADI